MLSRAVFSPRALGESPSLLLPASGGSRESWRSLVCSRITSISASVFTGPSSCPYFSVFFLLIRIPVIALGPILTQYDLILISTKTPFQRKVTLSGAGGWDLNLSFWGTQFNPLQVAIAKGVASLSQAPEWIPNLEGESGSRPAGLRRALGSWILPLWFLVRDGQRQRLP